MQMLFFELFCVLALMLSACGGPIAPAPQDEIDGGVDGGSDGGTEPPPIQTFMMLSMRNTATVTRTCRMKYSYNDVDTVLLQDVEMAPGEERSFGTVMTHLGPFQITVTAGCLKPGDPLIEGRQIRTITYYVQTPIACTFVYYDDPGVLAPCRSI